MKVRFTDDFNYRFPSRAEQFFPAGFEGTVKREIGTAAIAKGKAIDTTSSNAGSDRELVEPDVPDDGSAPLRPAVDSDAE